MELASIKEFLRGYQKFLVRDSEQKKSIVDALYRVTGIVFSEQDIEVSKGTLRIKGDFTTRNELFLLKERIMSEFSRSSVAGITDIQC
jgi:hypothetical protein